MQAWLKTLLSVRPHFFAALAMFLLVAHMTQEQSRQARVLLIAPVAALFVLYAVLFALEYEELSKKPVKTEKKK